MWHWRHPGRSNRPGGAVRPGGGGQTAQEGQSDRVGRTASRRSKAEDTRRDRMACVEEKRGTVLGCPSDGDIDMFPILPLMGVYRPRGILVICHHSGTSYILEMGGRWVSDPGLGFSFVSLFFSFIFLFSIGLA